jgi:signal transduction histidine kinase
MLASQGHTFRDLECRLQVAGGGLRHVLNKGKAIFDEHGVVTDLVGAILDITRFKELEIQLRRAQKMQALGQLAGGLAHDFNNLLVAVLGNLELAEASDDDEQRSELLAEARHAGERAAELTRQLLAFGRARQTHDKPLDLKLLLSDTLNLLRRLIPPSIQVEVVAPHRLPAILGDRSQIEQVVLNLCLNARDAMPMAGRLSLETQAVDVSEAFCETHPWARPGRYVLLRITDTGRGISPAIAERIFEPFFTTKEHGTGLGLATVYAIVQRHNGFIHVQSEPGTGSTFNVYLPTTDREVEGDVKATPTSFASRHPSPAV